MTLPSRRQALTVAGVSMLGALGLGVAVERGLVPGRTIIDDALGVGDPPSSPSGTGIRPDDDAGPVVRGTFDSTRRGRRVGWVIAYPPGTDPQAPRTAQGARLPVCVVLHGKGVTAERILKLRLPHHLAAATSAGAPAFALAAIDGGNGYWHARRSGDDPGGMVLSEWLPRLDDAGLAASSRDRVGFVGWSMGGYGALLLASRLGRERVAAAVALSPALWRRPGDTAPGAFDDADDYRRNDVFARGDQLHGVPLRIACGDADPFFRSSRAFAEGLTAAPETDFGPGDHSDTYWSGQAPAAFAFLGRHLAA